MRKILLFFICVLTACSPVSIGESAEIEIPTSSPDRIWLAPPVILEYYEAPGGLGTIDESVPRLVLYSNGDILIKKYEEDYNHYSIYKANLEKQKMCKFLLDIEHFGFFEETTKIYDESQAPTDQTTTYITVRAWENQDINLYGLYPDENTNSALANTYNFLNNYMPTKFQIYFPDTIDIDIFIEEPWDENEEVKKWIFPELKLSEIVLEGNYSDYAQFRLNGEIAKKLSEFIGNTWVGFVEEQGVTYFIRIVPHLPLQIKPEVSEDLMWFSETIPYSYPMTPVKMINCN